ncbi:MAG: hypothetical protein R3263_11435 [Myxococcota bacterium]|nr:hypothetical protein [Myxococcota bacterium]
MALRIPAAVATLLVMLLTPALLARAAQAGSFNRVSGPGLGGIASGDRSGPGGGGGPGLDVERQDAADPPDADDDAAEDADALPAAAADAERGDPDGDDAGPAIAADADTGERTFGTACVYGPRGRVIYAPPDRRCGLEAAQRRMEATGADAAPAGSGRCILGGDGGVVYAPPGVDCTRPAR